MKYFKISQIMITILVLLNINMCGSHIADAPDLKIDDTTSFPDDDSTVNQIDTIRVSGAVYGDGLLTPRKVLSDVFLSLIEADTVVSTAATDTTGSFTLFSTRPGNYEIVGLKQYPLGNELISTRPVTVGADDMVLDTIFLDSSKYNYFPLSVGSSSTYSGEYRSLGTTEVTIENYTITFTITEEIVLQSSLQYLYHAEKNTSRFIIENTTSSDTTYNIESTFDGSFIVKDGIVSTERVAGSPFTPMVGENDFVAFQIFQGWFLKNATQATFVAGMDDADILATQGQYVLNGDSLSTIRVSCRILMPYERPYVLEFAPGVGLVRYEAPTYSGLGHSGFLFWITLVDYQAN